MSSKEYGMNENVVSQECQDSPVRTLLHIVSPAAVVYIFFAVDTNGTVIVVCPLGWGWGDQVCAGVCVGAEGL